MEGSGGDLWGDPESKAILARVDEAFGAWRKASARLHRLRKPDAIEAQRGVEREAEKVYREAAAARDAHREILVALRTQREGR